MMITPTIAEETFLLSTTIIVVLLILLLKLCDWRCIKMRSKEVAPLQEIYKRSNDGQVFTTNIELESENPINQQDENLPFDRKYEIGKEFLIVSQKLLGEGQFGKVFEGSITSPITKKEIIPVAVKIPQHVGAITKFMAKGELYVITEFCELGELREYIRQRRAAFLDEIVPQHTLCSKNSISRQNLTKPPCTATSDITWENYTEKVKLIHFCSLVDSDTTIYVAETDPNWAQDQQENRSTDILTTSDILSYCYQSAKGMEYLVQKKVLHRDLAARNLLLSKNQIVKVSDFSLAKNGKSYEMKTSQNLPLPVRWMALESIVDQKVTDTSDVWSFGVVLWELFSFGKFPYAEVDGINLEASLMGGKRLDRPPYAPIEIYRLMEQTWQRDPIERPTFDECYTIIGEELKRCSKPLFEQINRKLADERPEKLHSYVDWRKIESA